MEMKTIKEKIKLKDLQKMAESQFIEMIKAVVDIEKKIMVVGGDLHANEEALLLDKGSNKQNLWGINIYFEEDDIIEFDSMINIRPSQGNISRTVEDAETEEKISKIVDELVER